MEQQQESSSEQQKYPNFEGWADDNRERFVEVDDMPHDGTDHQRNSPYLIRRRAQTKLLRGMWANFWPNYPPLTTQEAKRLLNACGNWAEEVLNWSAHCASYQYRGTKMIEHPVQYILDAIKNEMKADGKPSADVTDQAEEDADAA